MKELYLERNEICDINVFERTNFQELNFLSLNENKINDIRVFEKIKLDNLEILDLRDNDIDKEENSLIIENLRNNINEFFD